MLTLFRALSILTVNSSPPPPMSHRQQLSVTCRVSQFRKLSLQKLAFYHLFGWNWHRLERAVWSHTQNVYDIVLYGTLRNVAIISCLFEAAIMIFKQFSSRFQYFRRYSLLMGVRNGRPINGHYWTLYTARLLWFLVFDRESTEMLSADFF